MRDNYDFSDAIKNPFAGMIKGKYTVTIHYDFNEQDIHEEYEESMTSEKVQVKEEFKMYGG